MALPHITVFAEFDSPRLRYTLSLCLEQLLGCTFHLVLQQDEFEKAPEPRIAYSNTKPNHLSILWIPEEGLLREIRKIRTQEPATGQDEMGWYCFNSPMQQADFNFDLFSAVFYFASRYEEYVLPERDAHGRFPAKASLAYRNGCLERPVAEEWITRLRTELRKRFPDQEFPLPAYRFTPSYDIDIPWAYRHRSWWRTGLSWTRILLREGAGELGRALQIWAGKKADPYDCFEWLEAQHLKTGAAPVYFFPMGDYSRFDKNPHHRNQAYRNLIRELASKHSIGLHPSYRSSEQVDCLRTEYRRLSDILGTDVQHSRQHYLRFRVPETFQQLEALGVRQEYSMGFADAPGYRAGLSVPFVWYDVAREQVGHMEIVPFLAMDVSLKRYQQMEPDQALNWLKHQVDYLKQHGGHCCTIWHNNSLSEQEGWEGWRELYQQFLEHASNTEPDERRNLTTP
jgi:hypothetical protein